MLNLSQKTNFGLLLLIISMYKILLQKFFWVSQDIQKKSIKQNIQDTFL